MVTVIRTDPGDKERILKMGKEEKLAAIAEALDVDVEEISEDDVLESYDTWDSVAVLTLISFINDKFNRFPHASEIAELKTVKDVIDYLSE